VKKDGIENMLEPRHQTSRKPLVLLPLSEQLYAHLVICQSKREVTSGSIAENGDYGETGVVEVDNDTNEHDWKMLTTTTTDNEWSEPRFRHKATCDQSG